jgi:hypothetical protein
VLLSKFLDQGPLKVLPQFHPFPKSWTEGPKHHEKTNGQVAKQILVIARDRQKLYDYAKRAFFGNATVEVVLDRRTGERRRNGERAGTPDRRRGDRRLMLEVENHLRAMGWAVVRLDVFRTLGLSHRTSAR